MLKFMSKMTIMFAIVTVFLTGCSESANHLDNESDHSETVLQDDADIIESNEVELQQDDSAQQAEEEPIEVEEVVQSVDEGKIHFINTGNSDAILIENQGYFAMIDTGDTDDDVKVKSYLQKQGVKRLEYLVLTHYHADHIGGADTLLSDFEVGTTLVPNGDANTQVYRDYINALSHKGLKPSVPLEGAKFELGSATLTVYNTAGGNRNENNNSLVVVYENGEDKALFTGDAEAEVENQLSIGDIELLKVGHHGSKTSSSPSFINQIQPEYAVILTGQPNQYGHPHQETLSLFESKGIPVYRTDEQGDIVFTSTGHGFETELSPGSYTPGQSSSNSNTSEPSSSTQDSSSGSTHYKDDNPNGIYNQESTQPKESYKNCTLLREVYPNGVPEGHPAYESKHDRDKDGWACER